MDIGPYISELLHQQKYVVLPGFGAFVANYRPARFDVQTAMLLPPSRTITFQPELNLNDGILLNYVARSGNIPAPLAHKELEAYCDELLYQLDHGKPIVLNQLGVLTRTGQTFRFEAYPEAESLDEAYGLDSIHPATIGAALHAGEIPERAPEERIKKTSWWLYAAIFMLIATSGVALYLTQFSKDSTHQPKSSGLAVIAPDLPLTEPAESVEMGELIDSTAIMETVVAEESAHPAVGYHYLIGGSFRTLENAHKYMAQMATKGTDTLLLGWINNFFLVAISVTADEEEAVELKNQYLANNPQSGVWVYSHKE